MEHAHPLMNEPNTIEHGWLSNTLHRALGTFTALRFPQFRLFWIGLSSQIIGQQMFQVTVGWLAFELTGSPAALAMINGFAFIPRALLTLLGGALADRWDQRRLITVAQAISMTAILTIGTLTLTGRIEVWHLAVSAFLLGLSQSIDEPSRSSIFPRLLPNKSHIPSAVPLMSLAWSSTRIFAPSIAGFVIAAWGADTSFFIAAGGAATMVTVMRLIHPAPASEERARGNVMRNIVEGLQYVRQHDVFAKAILSAFVYATFASGYVFMLPVFAKDVLRVDEVGLGVLTSAAGIGSVAGLVTFGFVHSKLRPGAVIIMGLTLFSLSLIGVAASRMYWLTWGLLVTTGMAHIYFQTSANVILQSLVDSSYRGRVMSLYGQLWSLMLLSGVLLNGLAALVGATYALGGGALVLLAFTYGYLARSSSLRHVRLDSEARPRAAGH